MHKWLIVYSSLTGNTKQIAEAMYTTFTWLIVYSSLTGNTKQIAEAMYTTFTNGEADIFSIKEIDKINLDDYDYIAVGYWLTRGAPDKTVQEFLTTIKHKTVMLFQTHGTEPGSEHAVTAFARAAYKLGEDCTILGTFSSQGKINPALLARRQNNTAIKNAGKVQQNTPMKMTFKERKILSLL